jgi:hypothetical protein
MRAVNLLPRELRQHKSFREEEPAVVVGSALGVIVIIALASAFFVAHGKAGAQQARLTRAQLELAALSAQKHETPKPVKPSAPITPIVPPPSVTGQEATWLAAVGTNLSQRIAFDRLLRDVSLVVPDDITLTSMTMAAPATTAAVPGVPPPASAQGFTIAGTAFSYDSVARLLSRLSLVPDLSGVTLTSTGSGAAPGASGADAGSGSGSDAAGSTSVQFNISAGIKGAPVAPAPAPVVPAPVDGTTTGVSS